VLDLAQLRAYPLPVRKARVALSLLLAFAVPVRAETTTDPLWYLLSTYVLVPDQRAVEAAGDEADAKGLAGLQADLQLLADGFEAFRDEAQVQETLAKLEERMSPELRPFFKTRATSLDAIYRTLAVTDYTWSLRFPEPPCGPAEKRGALLSANDGLFADEKGEASPWLVSLLGEKARGKAAAQALDLASSKTRLSPADYEKRRALVRRLTLALASGKAEGAARAGLYCQRAAVYEELAAHHRTDDTALILVARGAGRSRPEESVFVVVKGGRRAAATLVKTEGGTALLTDAAAVEGADETRLFAYGADMPVELETQVLRRDAGLGLALLRFEGERQALSLADSAPEKDALVTALGHTQISGLWTETSGLVTKTDAASFHTDAAISTEFTGGPALDESGRVAGLFVARPADTEEGRWPVAVPAPVIARWLEDPAAAPAPTPDAGIVEDAGTAAILSRARPHGLTETALPPMIVPGLPPPPPTPRGVCVSGCNIPAAPSRSQSYSRSSPSTGSSGSGGAEMGQALGEAMAPLVQALVFQGIPALFRGIGKLFQGKGDTKPSVVKAQPRAESRDVPKPEPPKPPVPRCDLSLLEAPETIGIEPVDIVVRVTCDRPEAPLAGHLIRFDVQLDGAKPSTAGSAETLASGEARLRLSIRNEETKRAETVRRAEDSLDALERESKSHAESEEDDPAGALSEDTLKTSRSSLAPDEPQVTPNMLPSLAGTVSYTVTTHTRRILVTARVVRAARVVRTASLAAAPGTGTVSLGITVASAVLLFAAEREIAKSLARTSNLEPPGDCSDERHADLHREQGRKCKSPPRTCDRLRFKDCVNLRLYLERNRLCDQAERKMMDECFRGGNDIHRILNENTRKTLERCRERVRDECE
jgi:S1-C subfamily serine protease